MSPKRTNYREAFDRHDDSVDSVEAVHDEPHDEIAHPEKIKDHKAMHYAKFNNLGEAPIRIREKPNINSKHTGEYLTKKGVVEFDELKDGWGHIDGKGWVCLDYLQPL